MIKMKAKAAKPIKKNFKAVGPIKNRTKYEYWVEFDVLGEDEVRTKLEGGKYGGGRLEAAIEWISIREENQKREKKRDGDVQKAMKAAKSAQFAAWLTASAAILTATAALYFYFS